MVTTGNISRTKRDSALSCPTNNANSRETVNSI